MAMADHHPLIYAFGILGNIISILMFLAPMPTFIRIYRKKSTEGFQSIPYVVALFSCMLWIYYAILKSYDYLLLSINSFGCLVESIYILLYIFYAPKKAKVLTLLLLFLMSFAGFIAIVAPTYFFAKGSNQLHIVGWFCFASSVILFAAPLSIIRLVIRTKSVEFMPFNLSICLTSSAIMWLLYGILLKDLFIALPNIFGLVFGAVQILLYAIYWHGKEVVEQQQNLPEENVDETIGVSSIKTFEVHALVSLPIRDELRRKPNGENIETLMILNEVQPIDEIV